VSVPQGASPAIALRCEGSAAVGLGHVMRAMSLAEAARRRGAAPRFVMHSDGIANAIPASQGYPVDVIPRDLAPDVEAAWLAPRLAPGAWIVVDGYGLGGLVSPLRARGLRVCAIDDAPGGTAGMAGADLLVNPSVCAPVPRAGGDAPGPRALSGPRYAPVRGSFRRMRVAGGRQPLDPGRPARLLILSGGSDVAGLTARVLGLLGEAGSPFPALQVSVVLGPAASLPAPELLTPASRRITVGLVQGPREMASLMADADLAITAAGTSVLELLCLGVPPLMVTVVGNQAGAAAAVAGAGAGIDLGTPGALAADTLAVAIQDALARHAALAAAGKRLVDGGGARRVIAALAAPEGRRSA
jgi:spore coat polysaccharide biosynthesis predicted glycosyltransferase SpsG